MSAIEIRQFVPGLEATVYQLIREVFDEFVAPGYSEEGNSFFYAFIEPEAILLRQEKQNSILLAYNETHLAGMIEMRDNNHISLLFTRKEFMGHGIAGRLFNEAISLSLARNSETDRFFVHASPFSVPVYQRLGFKSTSDMQEVHGIKYFPMELLI
jgi:predicted GNAT family N-acyltransferase